MDRPRPPCMAPLTDRSMLRMFHSISRFHSCWTNLLMNANYCPSPCMIDSHLWRWVLTRERPILLQSGHFAAHARGGHHVSMMKGSSVRRSWQRSCCFSSLRSKARSLRGKDTLADQDANTAALSVGRVRRANLASSAISGVQDCK